MIEKNRLSAICVTKSSQLLGRFAQPPDSSTSQWRI